MAFADDVQKMLDRSHGLLGGGLRMRSMTGYGAGAAPYRDDDGNVVSGVQIEADIRTVNHRFLDVRVRTSSQLQDHIAAIEELVRKRAKRGRIEVNVRVEGAVSARPTLDNERARAAFEQLQALRDELAPGEAVPLSLLSTVPDLFCCDSARHASRAAVLEAVGKACDDVDAMRLREGHSLTQDLAGRIEAIRAKMAQVRLSMPQLLANHQRRLKQRLEKLLGDSGARVDTMRLEQEVALLADKTDVAEELQRLGCHCDQFDEIMKGTGPAHGRKLDFLLQEMGREVNTIGSKVQEPDVTRMVVELKADVERMREQVQNVM